MTLSARRKLVLPSAIACIAVFAAMTVPLAVFGDKQVRIKLEEESFFYGRLRDIAAPYVLLATVLSCGTGMSLAALIGWQQSTQKSLDCKNELSKLKVHLQDKEELIEQFKFSDSRLQISGLSSFLNGQDSNEVAPQPILVNDSESVSKLNKNKSVDTGYFSVNNLDVAEDFSDSLANDINSQINTEASVVNKVNLNEHSEIEELQQQMKDMMSRIEQLQTKTKSVPMQNSSEKASENFQAYYSSAD